MYGASLTALTKKCGGIRPIAVGNTYRRLVSKLCCTKIRPVFRSEFEPHQLGFAVKNGSEAGAHAARIYFNHPHQEDKVFMNVDFMNAFNMMRRDRLLDLVKEFAPEIYPFVYQCYRNPSNLIFGESMISSERGIQQGDPLGPALFCLVVNKLVLSLQSEFNLWYLDDATIGDNPAVVLEDFKEIIKHASELGLQLNPSKCELAILGEVNEEAKRKIIIDFAEIAPGIQIIHPDNAFLLGAPLTSLSLPKCLQSKIEGLKTFSERLVNISAHSAYFLLKHSFSTPRIVYFLRCCPTWLQPQLLKEYDAILKSLLEKITNNALNETSWMQSSLPVKLGGLGIQHAVNLSVSSFLASFHSTLPIISAIINIDPSTDPFASEGLQLWKDQAGIDPPPFPLNRSQRSWNLPLYQKISEFILSAASSYEDKARILASREKESGHWLNAVPSPQLGTHLDNDSFRISCAIRLGSPICQPHKCNSCSASVDTFGRHGLSCMKSAGRLSRHNSCNNVIKRALLSAEFPAVLEPPGCSRSDGKRPDGMTLVPWSRGKSLIWDVTCVDTFAPSYISETSSNPGSAAARAEKRKKRVYANLTDTFIFVPIAIETSGCWGKEAASLLKNIGRKIASSTSEPRSSSYFFQRVSLAVQRGNAACVLGTLSPGKPLDEVYYM